MTASLQALWVWVTSTFGGKLAASLFVSMLPVIELRGGIPIAVGLGLAPRVAIPVCVLGNILPIVPVILFIKAVFAKMRQWGGFFASLVDKLERKANKHRDVLDKYAWMGLVLLTAVPLPGTGAWTSSLLAALTGIRLKHAFPAIALGVVIAAVVIGTLSYGVAALV